METKYDKNNNVIYNKHSSGYEYWKEYDKNNNVIHYKSSNGFEYWKEYDKNNNLIHHKCSGGYEEWREYDKNNHLIHYKDSDGKEEWYDDNKVVTKERIMSIQLKKAKSVEVGEHILYANNINGVIMASKIVGVELIDEGKWVEAGDERGVISLLSADSVVAVVV